MNISRDRLFFLRLTGITALLCLLVVSMAAGVAIAEATGSATASAAPALPAWLATIKNPWVSGVIVSVLVQAFKWAPAVPTGTKKWMVLWSGALSAVAALLSALGTGDSTLNVEGLWHFLVSAVETFLAATGVYKTASHALPGLKETFEKGAAPEA